MEKKKKKPLIPRYATVPLIMAMAINAIFYYGSAGIASEWKHYDLTTSLDRMVPVIPQFVFIYLGCFIFWAVNYIIIARQGKEHCYRFITADIMARIICFVIYLVFPTTNIRPVLEGDGFWTMALQLVYHMDDPVNLFPSLHCIISWFCYVGIRGRKEVPRWYRGFSCVMAVLVFISTQVTKQHYLVDVISGVFIVELTYYIAFHTDIYLVMKHIFEKITDKIYSSQPV